MSLNRMYETRMGEEAKTIIKLAAEQTRNTLQSKYSQDDQIGKSNLISMANLEIQNVKKDLESDLADIPQKGFKFLTSPYVIRYLEHWKLIENAGNSYKIL